VGRARIENVVVGPDIRRWFSHDIETKWAGSFNEVLTRKAFMDMNTFVCGNFNRVRQRDIVISKFYQGARRMESSTWSRPAPLRNKNVVGNLPARLAEEQPNELAQLIIDFPS
jgi:hypothetical protein